MGNCLFCDLCNQKTEFDIYEDVKIKGILSDAPATKGHLILFPKTHIQIFEQLPKSELKHLFMVVNRMSSKLFELLKADGTNILINNGVSSGQLVPHFSVHIIPRYKDDSFSLDSDRKNLGEDELLNMAHVLKEGMEELNKHENDSSTEPNPSNSELDTQQMNQDQTNVQDYSQQLDRIP